MTTQNPTTITRWKWTLTTLDDKERYLSQMCAAGWRPLYVSFDSCYSFVRTEPGEYVCASAATIKMSGLSAGSFDRKKYVELAALLEAQGAFVIPQEMAWGSQVGIIAIRRADQGALVINSDTDSKIADLKARRMYCTSLAAAFFGIAVALLFSVGAGAVGFLGVAAAYGWPATKYSAAIKRLERNRAVFE